MKPTNPLNFRTSESYAKCVGAPNIRPIKFREMLPMQSRDRVSGKTLRQHDVACLTEMMQLFTCFSKKDFETFGCQKEISELNTCYQSHRKAKAEFKAKGAQGILVPGQKAHELSAQQANNLLKKYPVQQFMKKIRW